LDSSDNLYKLKARINIVEFITVFSKINKVLLRLIWIKLVNFEVQTLIKRWLHVIVGNKHAEILIECNHFKVSDKSVDFCWLMACLSWTWGATFYFYMNRLERIVFPITLESVFFFWIHAESCGVSFGSCKFSVIEAVLFEITSKF
jgi:hypothetical protein